MIVEDGKKRQVLLDYIVADKSYYLYSYAGR